MRPFSPLFIETFFPAPLAAKAADFNKRLANWQEKKASNAAQRQKLRQENVDLAKIDFDSIHAGCHAGNYSTELQGDLKLRREWADIREEVRQAYVEEGDAAYARFEAKNKEIAKRLEKIGFLPIQEGGLPQRGSWIPDMLHRHPEVLAAKGHLEEMQNKQSDRSQQQENQAGIEEIERELTAARERLVPA